MTPIAEQLLHNVETWAATKEDIRLVLVLGSQARTEEPADEFSDVDLVLSSTDHKQYLDHAEWLAGLGTPLLTFTEPTATGGEFERRVLFDTGLDVDFSVLPHARMQAMVETGFPADIQSVIARGLRVVVDKDGLAPRLLHHAQAGAPPWVPPSADQFRERTDDFLYHCLLAVRKAARGELFVAIESLGGVLRRHLFEAILNHRHLSSNVPLAWYGARMIERWAEPGIIEQLRSSCAMHDYGSVRSAVEAALDLNSSLGQEICGHLGFSYPTEAELRVRKMIAQIRSGPFSPTS